MEPIERTLPGGAWLVVERGDITRIKADAIVNAANETLLGGGGVDGAIHDVAGPGLLAACRAVREVRPGVRCPTGEARLTPGFRLPARFVIHTVGPIYESREKSAPLLVAAHANSFRLASDSGLRSIAFPAISCGAFGYPLAEAAPIALRAAVDAARDLDPAIDEIRFVLFDDAAFDAWRAALERLQA